MGTIYISTGVRYYNTIQSQSFVRNNCGGGFGGTIVAYTVVANTYWSTLSQIDADQKALDDIAMNGQAYANSHGSCVATIFYNILKSGAFTKNDCPEDFTGSSVTYIVSAHTYSADSQIEADALAQADVDDNGQDYANLHGNCTRTTFWNEEQSATFQKNDCVGSTTGSFVLYTVDAHTYSSAISVEDANDQALDDITDNGQAYANTHGTCLPNDIVNIFTVDFGGSTSYDLCMYIDTPGVSETGQIVARDGLNFFPLATPAAYCNMLASDNFNSSGITRRFEGNIGKLEADYPDAGAIPTFIFKIRGRAATAVPAAAVRYVKKGADQGNMTMTEATPGVHIPSVSSPSNNGIVDTTTHVAGGGDGTIGVGIGSVALTFTYTRATKALVVTTV